MEAFDLDRFTSEAVFLARYEALLAATACFAQATLVVMPIAEAGKVRDEYVKLMTAKTEELVSRIGGESPGDELSPNSELIVRMFSSVGDLLLPGSVFETD